MPEKKWYEMKALANNNAEIYIYDEIGYWGVTAKQFANDLKELGKVGEISLRINSPGGSVTDGIAIYNLLKKNDATVNVHIDGLAASMASVIAMAGDTVTMPENALMMVHNPWGYAMGDSEEMRKTADVLDKMKKALVSAYTAKSGMSDEDINAMLDDETWMTGSEALEWGFVDQTTDEVQLAASFDTSKLNQFKNKEIFKPLANAGTSIEEITMTGKTESANADNQVVTDPVTPDVKAEAQNAVNAFKSQENDRRKAIKAVFAPFKNQSDLLSECLEDMDCTADAASQKLLNKLGETADEPLKGGFVGVHVSNGDIVKESLSAAIKARAGIKTEDGEVTQDNPYRLMNLMEMARAALVDKGVGVASIGDRMSLVGAAFTHGNSDFSTVLADVANKSMLMGFEEAAETFQIWTKQGSLSDFKISHRVALNDMKSLPKVEPGAEFTYGTVGERGEQIALATYGQLFSINRQTIINDDLGAFTRIPQLQGAAAIRTVGDLVYAVLTSNPNMSDGNPLFRTQRNNLRTGAGGALSVDALTEARTTMRKQKLDGKALNLRPEYLIVPAALETTANKLMADTVLPGATNSESNPVSGMATVVSEARLDDVSATAWYLACGGLYDTIEVAYLDGQSTPFLDQMDGFTVDGTTMKVRIDAGVAPLEAITMYKANGA